MTLERFKEIIMKLWEHLRDKADEHFKEKGIVVHKDRRYFTATMEVLIHQGELDDDLNDIVELIKDSSSAETMATIAAHLLLDKIVEIVQAAKALDQLLQLSPSADLEDLEQKDMLLKILEEVHKHDC